MSFTGESSILPQPVPDAAWQAGITPRNWRKKVLLNGEPVPLAFAAGRDWVMCHPEPRVTSVPFSENAPLGLQDLVDEFWDKVILRGTVKIVAGDRI